MRRTILFKVLVTPVTIIGLEGAFPSAWRYVLNQMMHF